MMMQKTLLAFLVLVALSFLCFTGTGCRSHPVDAQGNKISVTSEILKSFRKKCPDTSVVLLKAFAKACARSTHIQTKAIFDAPVDSGFCIPYCKRFE
jgi:hypothetical protein